MTLQHPETIPAAAARAHRLGKGIVFYGQDAGARRIGYDELAESAGRFAAGLRDAGVGEGEHVLLVLPTGEDLLAAILGVSHAGAVPCLMSPPQGFGSRQLFQRRLVQLAQLVVARRVVTAEDLAGPVGETLGEGVEVLNAATLRAGPSSHEAPIVDAERTAIVQFTSGSTAVPRGVSLSHRAIAANVRQIASASGIDGQSVLVSWLPLFHDMGLVGSFLTALHCGCELVLGTPFTFMRRPASWIEAIAEYRGTHSLAPTFAYRYVLTRARTEELDRLDLASWQVAGVGAEPIHAEVLATFQERFAGRGLASTTLSPCYGLAEATLAVTLTSARQPYRTLAICRRALAERGEIRAPEGDAARFDCVGCGEPVPGTQVRIAGGEGAQLPERIQGEILVRGPSLLDGYLGEAQGPVDAEGWLHTGDLGFVDSGELFVTGRCKEMIILCGENHHPAEIEWAAEGVVGVRAGRVAAFGVPAPERGTEHVCVVVETDQRADVDPDDLVIAVRRAVYDAVGLMVGEVVVAAPGTIPLTTSGKLQRSALRARHLESRKS